MCATFAFSADKREGGVVGVGVIPFVAFVCYRYREALLLLVVFVAGDIRLQTFSSESLFINIHTYIPETFKSGRIVKQSKIKRADGLTG